MTKACSFEMCFSLCRNIIHGSDSVESAEKEIALWFKNKEDLVDWNPAAYKYVYEDWNVIKV